MRRPFPTIATALALGVLLLAAAPGPASAQTTTGNQQCGIQQAADLAVQRQLTLIDAAKTNTSEFFSGANSCIANELLSSIDLSNLIPDLSGFLTSAATSTVTKLLDTAKKKVCDIVNQQINQVIGQINSRLYQFQSGITGDLSSVLQGSFRPIQIPSIPGFGTQTLATPNTGATPVFTPVALPQPPATTTSTPTPDTKTVVIQQGTVGGTVTNSNQGSSIDWGKLLYGQ